MRAIITILAIALLAACASAPSGERTAVYDRKYNQTTYMNKQPESEFVGAGATKRPATKPQPGWYRFGHP